MNRRLPARSFPLLVALPFLIVGCGANDDERELVRFWAMGREGEVVQELVRDFETQHPSIRVEVQQIPWTAAHEKLLTAHVGDSSPDICQLGNTWIAEFVALNALEPLGDLVDRSHTIAPDAFFPGIWDTNVIEGMPFGVPWYVDTRVLFYRKDVLARAGYDSVPATWAEWREAMVSVKRLAGEDGYAILLPTNEFSQPVIFGLQMHSSLVAENGTVGAFSKKPFRDAFTFYVGLFESGLAPPVSNSEVSNLYQEFARGYFSMYVTGPWNLGEFERRLPPELADAWATAPLPGPEGIESGVSLAGGSSIVLFRSSERKEAAWKLIEFLSEPEQQLRFFELTGDLPARIESWEAESIASNERILAFGEQLKRVVATPKIPEWEQIATRVMIRAEEAIRGSATIDEALEALDRDVDRLLEKRAWLLEKRGLLPEPSPS